MCCRNAFGVATECRAIGADLQNCLVYLKEDHDPAKLVLAYPIGRQVGMRDVKTNLMRFLRPACDVATEVTCFAQTVTKKYLAVGYIRQADKRAYVSVHNVRNCGIKTKVHIDIDIFADQPDPTGQRAVLSMAFSPD